MGRDVSADNNNEMEGWVGERKRDTHTFGILSVSDVQKALDVFDFTRLGAKGVIEQSWRKQAEHEIVSDDSFGFRSSQ
jgi:hypothetical protein